MKVSRVNSPMDVKQTAPSSAASARAAAIAILQGQAPQQAPAQAQETAVADPNSISPEEMSAVQAPTGEQPIEQSAQPIPEEPGNTHTDTETEETIREKAKLDPESERRFKQLARQEKALRAKIQQQNQLLKQREAELKAREEALSKQSEQVDLSQYVPKSRLKEDALSLLEEAGVSYDELTAQVINRAPTDPRVLNALQKLEARNQALEDEIKSLKSSQTESQQQAYQAAVKQIKLDAQKLINTDPEFETIKAYNAIGDVVALIEKTYAKDGIVLSVEEAAQEVENFLVEEAERIAGLSKVQKRLQAKLATKQGTEVKTPSPQQKQTKTLTNAVSTQRPLTARERAILAMEGKLKA